MTEISGDSGGFSGSSDRLFREWVETSQELFWQVDRDGLFLYLNPAWEKALGYALSEMVGRKFYEFQPPAIGARDWDAMPEIMSRSYFNQYETTMLRKDGSQVHLMVSGKPLLDQDGQCQGMQGIGLNITERKRVEEALQISTAQLHVFISNAPTAIAMFNNELRYLAYSDRWLEDYGLQGQSLIGRHHYDIFPSIRDNAFWREVHQRVLKGESIRKDEDTFVGADGKKEWLRWDVRPWRHPSGDIGGLIMLTESITARRRAEEELRASEERYRQLSDSAFEGIMIHENGIMLDMNKAFYAMHGYEDKSDLVGKDALSLLLAPSSRAKILALIAKEENSPTEVHCLRKDGSEFVGAAQSRPSIYEGKKARLVTLSDISERKRAEAALAAEKERLSVTLQSIGDGVIATDTQGRVMILNTIAEKLTGWPLSEAENRPLNQVFRIVHETSKEVCENPVDRVLSTGAIIELANHTLLIARDGSERVITNSGAPIRNAEDKIIGVVLVFRDMTEKQKLIEAAQRSQKLESLGILAGGIAHDFNNLLGGIFGYIDLVHSQSTDPTLTHYLAKAMNTIDRARGLTQQLLTFAKGGLPLRKAASLFPFIEETVHFVLSGTAVTSRFQVAPDLMPCCFDRNQIGQVIDNLVINAQQAMPTGGLISVTADNARLSAMQVAGLSAGDYVHLTIRDTGTGIPQEVIPRIFDPFFTTKQKGSGLGLATCYSIIRQHDGGIEVESEPGKGTTFHLYLPASRQMPEAEIKNKAPETKGKGCVLIMDDEEVIRETYGEMLRLAGYEVKAFADGKAVIQYLLEAKENLAKVSAIMLDLTVPGGMGGREAAGEIRKITTAIPIFISSGYGEDPLMANPTHYGITDSIGKPFRRADLLALLQKHL